LTTSFLEVSDNSSLFCSWRWCSRSAFSQTEETPGERVMRSWVLALLVIGEVLSLAVVAGGLHASKGTASLVSSAMLGSAFLLSIPVVGRELLAERTPHERIGHASARLLVLGAIVGTLIGHPTQLTPPTAAAQGVLGR
jgi:hypothetical protein